VSNPSGGWGLALTTSLLALAGVIVGLSFFLRGPVSRPGDLIYHLTILVALLLTIALLIWWRRWSSRSAG
jgi:hypothetical protein